MADCILKIETKNVLRGDFNVNCSLFVMSDIYITYIDLNVIRVICTPIETCFVIKEYSTDDHTCDVIIRGNFNAHYNI